MAVAEEVRARVAALGLKSTFDFRDMVALGASYWSNTYESVAGKQGWRHVGIADGATGYDALGIFHKPSETLVIVNRGAEGGFFGEDWKQGVSSTFGSPVKPISEGLDFAADCWRTLRSEGLGKSILVTGHSWGGALADAQAALLRQVLGDYSIRLKGLGFGSAGFVQAIQATAAKRKLDWVGSFATDSKHFIRTRDPIRITGSHAGAVIDVGSIYSEVLVVRPSEQPRQRWERSPVQSVNHSGALYFQWPDISASQHILITRGGSTSIGKGSAPRLLARPS